MADKKKNNKTIKMAKAIKKQPKPKAIAQNQEKLFSIRQISQILNVPSFELYIVKKRFNIDDGALLTVSQFKEMYKQAMEGR